MAEDTVPDIAPADDPAQYDELAGADKVTEPGQADPSGEPAEVDDDEIVG